MSKKNDDFFKEKKPWSKVKDELLGCYLMPYVQKILHTHKPLVYVDCFAGKGKFEDGNPGSPIIALDTMQKCIGSTTMNSWDIQPYFIELNHAEDLRNNLSDYGSITVISGKYEDEISNLLQKKNNCNVFLYVDPYGIKALNCGLFDSFANRNRFNSIELLINMNSFGFIREGCRVLGAAFENEDMLEDLVEYAPTHLTSDERSKQALTEIAGGTYWVEIINSYKRGEIDIYEAENRFSCEYCQRLRQSYKYVLNMPLRIKAGQVPKYRMIHATNHAEGCILMADNMCGRWELMQDIQTCGQQMLWEETPDNNVVDESEIRQKVIDHISGVKKNTRMNLILADFFSFYGVICPSKTIKGIYRSLEKEGHLVVTRNPAFTSHRGSPSTFFADEKGKKTELRWNV